VRFEGKLANRFVIFDYPECASGDNEPDWCDYADPGGSATPEPRGAADEAKHLEWESRLAEEVRKAFNAGRERGHVEAREAAQEALASARGQEERRMAGLVRTFSEASERYLQEAEGEVVRLAVAVAARILRREAQMDPLLLTGAVRVALGQLSATTRVRLRVPVADLELWREAIAHIPNLALKPELVGVEGLHLGDCEVESEVGTVDLGIRTQLGEIERGFFDRASGNQSADPEPPRELATSREGA
jgi:flagellar assembly protein FliH